MPARQHGHCPHPAEVVRNISGSRRLLMIRSADSELATNRCCSSGTKGELRALGGFAHSDSLIRLIIPLSEVAATSQTSPAPTFHAQLHSGCSHFQGEQTIQN